MEIFTSVDDLARVLAAQTKWRRVAEALEKAPALPVGVAHSVGDSLTYWREPGPTTDEIAFIGKRRYLQVLHVLGGEQPIEHAPVGDLVPTDEYSDLADRQHLTGRGTVLEVVAGSVVVVGSEEAVRRLAAPEASLVTVHLTVEGATFHNK
jgi:evolved beta-galactosidase subunit beta